MLGLRSDDIRNFLSGLGMAEYSRSRASSLVHRRRLSCVELDAVWEQRGLGAVVSERPADDMTREGWELQDADGVALDQIGSVLEDLEVADLTRRLYEQGSHYGGALLIAAVDDGRLPAEPLDERRIRSIEGFAVLDRHAVQPIRLRPGPPEAYQIMSLDLEIPLAGRVVHHSRVLKFNGPIRVAERRSAELDYWGVPILERVWQELRSIWTSLGYAEEYLHDMSIDVFSIPKLHEAVRAGKADEIKARVKLANRLKSGLRALILDGGNPESSRPPEQLASHVRSATGLAEVLDRFMPAFVAATGIPRSILLGETVGGLNTGTNSGEHRAWNARIKALQRSVLTPWLNWILGLVFAAKDGPTRGTVPSTWTIAHRDLMAPTEAEQTETELKRAEADRIYALDIGAVSGAEVRRTRFEERSTGPLKVEGPPPLPPGMRDPVEEARRRASEAGAGGAA